VKASRISQILRRLRRACRSQSSQRISKKDFATQIIERQHLLAAFARFDQFASQHTIQNSGRKGWRDKKVALAHEYVCPAALGEFVALIEKDDFVATGRCREAGAFIIIELAPGRFVSQQWIGAVNALR